MGIGQRVTHVVDLSSSAKVTNPACLGPRTMTENGPFYVIVLRMWRFLLETPGIPLTGFSSLIQ